MHRGAFLRPKIANSFFLHVAKLYTHFFFTKSLTFMHSSGFELIIKRSTINHTRRQFIWFTLECVWGKNMESHKFFTCAECTKYNVDILLHSAFNIQWGVDLQRVREIWGMRRRHSHCTDTSPYISLVSLCIFIAVGLVVSAYDIFYIMLYIFGEKVFCLRKTPSDYYYRFIAWRAWIEREKESEWESDDRKDEKKLRDDKEKTVSGRIICGRIM